MITLSPASARVLLDTLEDIKRESCLSDDQMALYVLVREALGRPVGRISPEVTLKTHTLRYSHSK